LFLILGIVIIIAIVGIVFFSEQEKKMEPKSLSETQIQSTPFDTSALQFFMQQCLTRVEEEALMHLGSQGGYDSTKEPTVFFYSNILRIPLYFNATNNEEHIPSLIELEQGLNSYVSRTIGTQCNVQSFSVSGLTVNSITEGNIQAVHILKNNSVSVTINYPLVLFKEGVRAELNTFSVDVPTRIVQMYEEAKNLAKEKAETGSLCITCISDWTRDNEFTIEKYDNIISGTSIITLRDPKHIVQGKAQLFTFAITEKTHTNKGKWYEW